GPAAWGLSPGSGPVSDRAVAVSAGPSGGAGARGTNSASATGTRPAPWRGASPEPGWGADVSWSAGGGPGRGALCAAQAAGPEGDSAGRADGAAWTDVPGP